VWVNYKGDLSGCRALCNQSMFSGGYLKVFCNSELGMLTSVRIIIYNCDKAVIIVLLQYLIEKYSTSQMCCQWSLIFPASSGIVENIEQDKF